MVRAGIDKALAARALADVAFDEKAVRFSRTQPEYRTPIWDYMAFLVDRERIATGQAMLKEHASTLAAVEKAYGVDRHFIAAIWGIESNYGTQIGERPVIRSTATLACIGRRQDYFRDEFVSALEILARADVRPDHLRGSWAGAFGPTQFMPTSFKRFAVGLPGRTSYKATSNCPIVKARRSN